MVTLEEMKNYLRVDDDDDDVLIGDMITAAERQCMDILRTDSEEDLKAAQNGKIAVMFTAAYFYEHRGEGGQEKATAGLTVAESDIAFTVRFCKQAAEATPDGFRILFQGEIYNIAAVDHMNYKKKALKFRCEKARR